MDIDGIGFFSLMMSDPNMGAGSVNQGDQTLTLEELKSAPTPLHVVCGTFDFLQPGNLDVLQAASLNAGSLLVVIPDDQTVKDFIASNRPFHSAQERTGFLKHVKGVDKVCVLSQATAASFFQSLTSYTFFGCGNMSNPLGDIAAEHAASIEDLSYISGCSTPDIVYAINDQNTPIEVAGDMPPVNEGLNGPRVTVNGCFDILHLGHLDMLQKSRAMGGSLTVLINSDQSVKRYKGETRPVFPQHFRAKALLALESVDNVMCFDEDNPLSLLEQLKPDIHVKGGSYEPERVQSEKELLESWGGEIRFCPLLEGYSTSSIIKTVG